MPRRRTDLDEAKDDIISRYKAGESARSIAAAFDAATPTISRRLRNWGVAIDTTIPGRPKELLFDMNELIAKYEAGVSTISLGKIYGVSNVTILNRLKAHGVELRSPGGYNYIDLSSKKEVIVGLYQSGENISDIAKRFEVSHQTISRRLEKWGAKELLLDNISAYPRLLTYLIADQTYLMMDHGLQKIIFSRPYPPFKFLEIRIQYGEMVIDVLSLAHDIVPLHAAIPWP